MSHARIVRLNRHFDTLVSRDTVIEKLAGGFSWTEGPVWNREGKFLLFSDIPDNAVHRWKEGEGVRLFLKPSGYTGKQPFTGREPGSNGLVFDTEGRLVLCQHGDRCIGRLEKDGSRTILVDHYEGRKLNSPNDLVFKSNGDLYFTDPPYGLPDTFHDPARELDFCGVYRLRKEGELTLLAKHLAAPNGIAFSPDESILYVSDSKTLLWLAFDVREDGTIENCRTLYNASEQKKAHPGCPDGMKLDVDGNIFGAGPGGVYVIAPDGILLGKFDFGAPTGNCAWGEEGSTLFVTCNDAIYRIRLTTKGAGWNH